MKKNTAAEQKETEARASTPVDNVELDRDSIAYYNIFYSQFCRNCPPVKNFMDNLELNGENIDVSTDLGLDAAREYDVMSTPAVLLFDKNKNIIQKAHSIEELESIFAPSQAGQLSGV